MYYHVMSFLTTFSGELLINWETGTQLLNLVKALRKWMHNAGVHNYNDALQLLNEFARLMATPRQELISVCLPS